MPSREEMYGENVDDEYNDEDSLEYIQGRYPSQQNQFLTQDTRNPYVLQGAGAVRGMQQSRQGDHSPGADLSSAGISMIPTVK